MGKSEDNTPPKSEKESSSTQAQTNIRLYPDWGANQAYYGPGVPFPSPYLYSAVMAGHFPQTCVWAPPQPLMPPYGVPYTTIYSHGGVCAHPAVPFVATPLSTEMPSKSSDNMDQGLTKKLKKLDGLAAPVGNDSVEGDSGDSGSEASQSVERGIFGSTEGSNGNIGAYQTQRKSGSEGMPSTDKNVNVLTLSSSIPEEEANATSTRVLRSTVAPASVAGKSAGSPNGKTDTTAGCVASAGAGLSFKVWVQDERQLKRERRKQANRESARRSRLRKQAENEELMTRYDSLNVENVALKSELIQLTADSEKLRLENAALLEKLNNAQPGWRPEVVPVKMEAQLALPNTTENLPGLNNSDSLTITVKKECESHENSNSGTNHHQLLEPSSRTDAVAAS